MRPRRYRDPVGDLAGVAGERGGGQDRDVRCILRDAPRFAASRSHPPSRPRPWSPRSSRHRPSGWPQGPSAGRATRSIPSYQRPSGRAKLKKSAEQKPEPAVSVRRSIRPDDLVCLVRGKPQKMLKRHLEVKHGLAPAEYRERFGLKPDYPMTAPDYAQRRREVALATGLGRPKRPARRGRKSSVRPRRRSRAHRRPRPRHPPSSIDRALPGACESLVTTGG
jgi:predicted transcriptional regulator